MFHSNAQAASLRPSVVLVLGRSTPWKALSATSSGEPAWYPAPVLLGQYWLPALGVISVSLTTPSQNDVCDAPEYPMLTLSFEPSPHRSKSEYWKKCRVLSKPVSRFFIRSRDMRLVMVMSSSIFDFCESGASPVNV